MSPTKSSYQCFFIKVTQVDDKANLLLKKKTNKLIEYNKQNLIFYILCYCSLLNLLITKIATLIAKYFKKGPTTT